MCDDINVGKLRCERSFTFVAAFWSMLTPAGPCSIEANVEELLRGTNKCVAYRKNKTVIVQKSKLEITCVYK